MHQPTHFLVFKGKSRKSPQPTNTEISPHIPHDTAAEYSFALNFKENIYRVIN